MRKLLALAVATIATFGCLSAHAASFSSSATYSGPHQNAYRVSSGRSKPGDAPNTGFIPPADYASGAKLNASLTSASVDADTTADTGDITAMGIGAFGVTPTTSTSSVTTSLNYLVANFPSPPSVQSISGTWQESITINGVSGPAPGFSSVAPVPVYPEAIFLPWYTFNQQGILTGSTSIFLTGTYQVIGPVTTLTIPINIELQPVPAESYAVMSILGSNSFGNGFTFIPGAVGMHYNVVNPTIFFGEVDHLLFNVTLESGPGFQVVFAQNPLPEPSCCVLLGMAGLAMVGLRRGRR